MKLAAVVLAAASVFAAGAAQADALTDLMAKNGCIACHQVATKLVGPAYIDVAKKYRGDAKAPAALAAKVKAGGVGVWGQVPMPPNPQVKDPDLKALIAGILALK